MVGFSFLACADGTLHTVVACILPFTQARTTRTLTYVRLDPTVILGQAFLEHAQFVPAGAAKALDYLDWPLPVANTTSYFVLPPATDFVPAIVHEPVGGNCMATGHLDALAFQESDHARFIASRNRTRDPAIQRRLRASRLHFQDAFLGFTRTAG